MKKAASWLLLVCLVMSLIVLPVSAAGDSMKTATPIELGQEYSGSITSTNTVDFYKFTLPTSGRINLRLTAYIYETNYFLYDENGTQLWEKRYQYWNSVSEQYDMNENLDLTAGTYYFAVKQYDGTGDYKFKISFSGAEESFPETTGGTNNSIPKACPVSMGETYYGQIAVNDEKDFYQFTLPNSGRVNLRLTAYIYETNYYLYDQNGETVWSKTYQYWNNVSEELNLNENVDLTSGTYYFSVAKRSGTGNYNFTLSYTMADESFPETTGGNNNSVAEASYIETGKTYYGQIACNDAKDFYKFNLDKAGKVNVRVRAFIYETNYYIYDGNGNTVWKKTYQYRNSTSEEYNLDENVDLSAGTYYFAVELNSGTGNYNFTIGGNNPFVDVSSSDFFFNPVMWAVENSVTGGTDETHFSPNKTVMRSDSMVFFWAAKGRPAHRDIQSPFKDVKKKHWFYDAVLWAVENSITAGTDATHFSPNNTCSRSEILQFLYAAMNRPAYTIANPYSDVKKSHWYYDGAIWAYENGLEKGENGKFNAKTPCTRGYVVTYLFRFITGKELAQ